MPTKRPRKPKNSAEAPEPEEATSNKAARKGSHLEERFLRCWEAAGGPPLERELCFDQEAVALEFSAEATNSAEAHAGGGRGRESAPWQAGGSGSGGTGKRKARRWRADFAHRPSRTLIEVDGGVFIGGRHTRGAGFAEDCAKHLAAWLQGWRVVRLCEPQIRLHIVAAIARHVSGSKADALGIGGGESTPEWLQGRA